MSVITLLMDEHRRIEECVNALVEWAARVAAGRTAELHDDAGDFVDFFATYADAHHHGKEEALLFSAMQRAGMPAHDGPLALLVAEHQRGRKLLDIVAAAAQTEPPWSDLLRREVVSAAREYATLLRTHIGKEDATLFPIAGRMLSDEELEALDEAVEEHELLHAQRRAQSELLANRLVRIYG